jgi:hypothetical protein
MGVEPGQDYLFQALFERCPGPLIALLNRTVPQLEARDLACLVDFLPHDMMLLLVFPCANSLTVIWRIPLLRGIKSRLRLNCLSLRLAETHAGR